LYNVFDEGILNLMKINPFALERYFAKYEFSAPYLLSCSDCEALNLSELLGFADRPSLALWDRLSLGYTESLGHPLLREEAARLYTKIQPEDVLIITPEEGIFIAMNVILSPGDHVICTFPGYQSLYEIAQSLGCQVTKWAPEEASGWKFNLDDLRASIQANTRLIVVNFPHNPTGSQMDAPGFAEILRIAGEKGIVVFSDEMYHFLEYQDVDRLESASDLYENAISLFGMSKTFSLAGLRIGWLTTRNKELYRKIAVFKDYTTICSSAPSEILAIMGLRAKDEIIQRNLGIIQANLSLLDQFFERHAGIFTWNRPKAGTIGFPRLLLPKNIRDFCLELVDKQGVMLAPGPVFGYAGSHFRVGFGRKNMPAALERLEAAIEELTGV
jgi:aspartate/methionine/tyrosine aminotransferase